MSNIPIIVFSDYVCPWCFMAESGLDLLRETHTVQVEWKAFELRPAGSPPIPAEYRARIRAGNSQMLAIARERFGLELNGVEPKESGASFLAHVGAKYAIENGKGPDYHHAVFAAHWQEEKDIASAETLVEIAKRVGLGEAEFRAALENPRYAAQVREEEEWAKRHGLGGVPAFIFGNRYLVSGAQPVEVLREVAERCVAEGLVV